MWLASNFEKIVCAVIFAAMTAIGFANVVVRYLTSHSFAATEEILVNGFVLMTVFGAAIAARRGEHLAVTLFYDRLGTRGRMVLLWLQAALAGILLLLSTWFTGELVANQMRSGTTSYGLQLPAWWYTIGLPLAFLLFFALLYNWFRRRRFAW